MTKAKLSISVFALLVVVLVSQTANAGVITYTTQSSFNAATSGLSTQTFGFLADEIPPGTAVTVNNSLNSSTNNDYVAPGDILPGLDISATPNHGNDLALVGPNFLGTGITNYSVFASMAGGQGLIFRLTPAVTAFSMNVLALIDSADASIYVYSPTSLLLGPFVLEDAPNSGSGGFFGVTTNGTDTISAVLVTAEEAPFPGVDQVQFGSAAVIRRKLQK